MQLIDVVHKPFSVQAKLYDSITKHFNAPFSILSSILVYQHVQHPFSILGLDYLKFTHWSHVKGHRYQYFDIMNVHRDIKNI